LCEPGQSVSLLADLHQVAVASDAQADWQRLWQALAGTRLVVPIDDPGADALRPRLASVEGVEAVRAFESMETYATLLDRPGDCAEIDGAELAQMLGGHDIALAVTIDGLSGPVLLSAEVLAWIAATYRADVRHADGAGVTVSAPDQPSHEMVELLGQTVAALGGDCPEAWLVSLTPPDGAGELTLVLDLAERARPMEEAIAETVTRAVQAGADRPVAVACAGPGSVLLGHARRIGIGIAGPAEGSG